MGVYEVAGADAASYLDTICSNDCGGLEPGESLYTHFMTPDADVIDDTLVYRRGWEKYLVVVNASNDDKDRAWFEAVRDGRVKIDNERPWSRAFGYQANIRNLRDPKAGDDMRVDIAFQGPKSRDILLAMIIIMITVTVATTTTTTTTIIIRIAMTNACVRMCWCMTARCRSRRSRCFWTCCARRMAKSCCA